MEWIDVDMFDIVGNTIPADWINENSLYCVRFEKKITDMILISELQDTWDPDACFLILNSYSILLRMETQHLYSITIT